MIEIEKAYPCGIILLKTPFIKDQRGNFTKSYSYENFKKIVNSSAFCSEKNNIVSDNYKITNNEKIGIIPPIGGG